ncbi:MAG: hypothetical protein JW751_28015 [Polyangiaceae bacterium]|nr:hypothetical protein [Polyangiaceae bacterium]
MSKLPGYLVAALRRPGPWLPITLGTGLLAWMTTRAILTATGGEPAVPLDDTFIHFQFARRFAELRPFEYSAGAPPVPGATSLLWPLLLAPFHALGLRGTSLIWVAWVGGWTSLWLLAHETWHVARGLLSRAATIAATTMVLAFGGHAWFAASGMEVIPFAWLLMRTVRRVAEHAEANGPVSVASRRELVALALLTPAMRPEGAVASLLVAATLAWFPRGSSRTAALAALFGPFLPGCVNWLATGEFATTTVAAKWLFATPYPARIPATLRYHIDVLFNTLLDGEIWSAVFVPRGGKWIAWLALPALVWAAIRERRWWRGSAILATALGVLVTTTYDSFLVNRLRYLWPFAAAWFVGLGALADAAGLLARRCRASAPGVGGLVGGAFVGLFAGHLPWTFDDVATSARAINEQQVALARWVATELPADAVIGVNDAGAIAYLGGRRTFDLVGLTTRGEARHWTAGPGSRFEHYEHLGTARLPTHLVIYDRWLQVPTVLGQFLTHRYVGGATILGDSTMSAYVARWDALGSAAFPEGVPGASVYDELDVADLASEADHGYVLFGATQQDNVVVASTDGRADGARSERLMERFTLAARPGTKWVARWTASEPVHLEVEAEGVDASIDLVGGGEWEEHLIAVPPGAPSGLRTVTIRSNPPRPFAALHYWAIQ